jgi:hypothetical protein
MSTPQINDGGPAFPTEWNPLKIKNPELSSKECRGMSLRDWFAGQALANEYTQSNDPAKIAEWAYRVADAMLKAREVKP